MLFLLLGHGSTSIHISQICCLFVFFVGFFSRCVTATLAPLGIWHLVSHGILCRYGNFLDDISYESSEQNIVVDDG